MIFSLKRQWIALGTFIAFTVSSLGLPIGHAKPFISNHSSVAKLDFNQAIQIPAEFGKIQEVEQAACFKPALPAGRPQAASESLDLEACNRQLVVLIQDAHAIPDAQRNIQQLIEFFHEKYGVSQVALEGTASSLDPKIFRSFPDQEKLKEVFNEYYEKGELTGSTAAAIFSATKRGGSEMVFQGIEDWKLYEEGLGFYQKAMEKEKEILEQLQVAGRKLQAEKEKAYSKELLEVDQALADFQTNRINLIEVLEKLSKIKTPEIHSELALLLQENQKTGSHSSLEREVKKAAEEVKKQLQAASYKLQKDCHLKPETCSLKQDVLAQFNQKYQEYRTSQISSEAFGLYLKTQDSSLTFSEELTQLIHNQKRLQDIQGTKLFKDFETYAQSAKESLFQNEEQRKLDARSRELELLQKLTKLELSREEWDELKLAAGYRLQAAGDQKPEAWSGQLEANITFYENAEKRDQIFFENLLKLQSSAISHSPSASILVAGGFHTEGLTQRFKEAGISYILITPNIQHIPEQTNYQAHMRGEVSWKDYFEVENGKVNLYKAFVRGTRDKLIGHQTQVTSHQKQPLVPGDLLKRWRDQIIRDLADKNELTKAHEYTQFIDEVTSHKTPVTSHGFHQIWLNRIHQFLNGLHQLDQANQLTPQNVTNLLRGSHNADPTYAIISRDELSAGLLFRSGRNLNDASTPLGPEQGPKHRVERSEMRSLDFKLYSNLNSEEKSDSELERLREFWTSERRRQWDGKSRDAWVAYDAKTEKPVGIISFTSDPDKRRAFINGTYIHPDFQKNGIGGQLRDKLISHLIEQGYETFYIGYSSWTIPKDKAVQKFYESMVGKSGVSEVRDTQGNIVSLTLDLKTYRSGMRESPDRNKDLWGGIDPARGQEFIEKNRAKIGNHLSMFSFVPAYRDWQIREIITKEFGSSLNILSLGAGRGHLEQVLQEQGHQVTAVEIDAEFVKEMQQKGITKAIQGDLFKLKELRISDHSFDLVIANEALNMTGLPVIAQVKDYLKPSGQILINEIKYDQKEETRLRDQGYPTVRIRVPEMRKAFKKYGLELVKTIQSPSFSFERYGQREQRTMMIYIGQAKQHLSRSEVRGKGRSSKYPGDEAFEELLHKYRANLRDIANELKVKSWFISRWISRHGFKDLAAELRVAPAKDKSHFVSPLIQDLRQLPLGMEVSIQSILGSQKGYWGVHRYNEIAVRKALESENFEQLTEDVYRKSSHVKVQGRSAKYLTKASVEIELKNREAKGWANNAQALNTGDHRDWALYQAAKKFNVELPDAPSWARYLTKASVEIELKNREAKGWANNAQALNTGDHRDWALYQAAKEFDVELPGTPSWAKYPTKASVKIELKNREAKGWANNARALNRGNYRDWALYLAAKKFNIELPKAYFWAKYPTKASVEIELKNRKAKGWANNAQALYKGDYPDRALYRAAKRFSVELPRKRSEIRTEPIKILFADKPAGKETISNVEKMILEQFGEQAKVLSTIGIGKEKTDLEKVLTEERPEIIVIRSDTKAFKEKDFLNLAQKSGARAIIRMGAGVDNVDTKTAAEAGISVIRTHGNANSVTNLALRFLIAGLQLPYDSDSVFDSNQDLSNLSSWNEIFNVSLEQFFEAIEISSKKGRGEIDPYQGQVLFPSLTEQKALETFEKLKNKTIGLVGFGPIPQLLAEKLKKIRELTGIPFTVMATSPGLDRGDPVRAQLADRLGVLYPGEEEVLKQSDILSFHLPGEAKNYFNLERLSKTKAAFLINTARQDIIAKEVFSEFFQRQGSLYFADVDMAKDGQPFPAIKELTGRYLKQFYVTPHIAASTKDAGEGVEKNTLPTLQATIEALLNQESNYALDIVNGVTPTRSELRLVKEHWIATLRDDIRSDNFEEWMEHVYQLIHKEKIRGVGKWMEEATIKETLLRRRVSEWYERLKEVLQIPSEHFSETEKQKLETAFQVLDNIGIGEIVFVSAEMKGIAMAGGLAMVIRDLSEVLGKMGIPVTVIMPFYEQDNNAKHRGFETIMREGVELTGKKVYPKLVGKIQIPIGAAYYSDPNLKTVVPGNKMRDPMIRDHKVYEKYQGKTRDDEVYLVENGPIRILLIRDPLYADKIYSDKVDSDGELQRMIFLSRGSLEAMQLLPIYPHVIQPSEKDTALIPALIEYEPDYGQFQGVPLVFWVHNNSYQGAMNTNQAVQIRSNGTVVDTHIDIFPRLNIPPPRGMDSNQWYGQFTDLQSWNRLNPLASAYREILRQDQDRIVTVSPNYAHEIATTSENGAGLEPLLFEAAQQKKLYGFSNGITNKLVTKFYWDAGEKALQENGQESLSEVFNIENYFQNVAAYKQAIKTSIQKEYGLNVNSDAKIISLVGRLTEQKGIALLTEEIGDENSQSSITVLEAVLKNYPNTQILLGGPLAPGDGTAENLKKVVESLIERYPGQIAARFKFIAHPDEALRVMLASDFFFMPSRFEPGGITQLEALKGGAVPIARNIGGIKSTLKDYSTGNGNAFLFDSYSGLELYQVTQRALQTLSNIDIHQKMIERNARENHDWRETVAPRYQALYQEGILDLYPHLESRKRFLDEARVNPSRSELRSDSAIIRRDFNFWLLTAGLIGIASNVSQAIDRNRQLDFGLTDLQQEVKNASQTAELVRELKSEFANLNQRMKKQGEQKRVIPIFMNPVEKFHEIIAGAGRFYEFRDKFKDEHIDTFSLLEKGERSHPYISIVKSLWMRSFIDSPGNPLPRSLREDPLFKQLKVTDDRFPERLLLYLSSENPNIFTPELAQKVREDVYAMLVFRQLEIMEREDKLRAEGKLPKFSLETQIERFKIMQTNQIFSRTASPRKEEEFIFIPNNVVPFDSKLSQKIGEVFRAAEKGRLDITPIREYLKEHHHLGESAPTRSELRSWSGQPVFKDLEKEGYRQVGVVGVHQYPLYQKGKHKILLKKRQTEAPLWYWSFIERLTYEIASRAGIETSPVWLVEQSGNIYAAVEFWEGSQMFNETDLPQKNEKLKTVLPIDYEAWLPYLARPEQLMGSDILRYFMQSGESSYSRHLLVKKKNRNQYEARFIDFEHSLISIGLSSSDFPHFLMTQAEQFKKFPQVLSYLNQLAVISDSDFQSLIANLLRDIPYAQLKNQIGLTLEEVKDRTLRQLVRSRDVVKNILPDTVRSEMRTGIYAPENTKILIIEDWEDLVESYQQVLQNLGYLPHRIFRADRVQLALDILEKEQPHIIFVDHNLVGFEVGTDIFQQLPSSKEPRVFVLNSSGNQWFVDELQKESSFEEIEFIRKAQRKETVLIPQSKINNIEQMINWISSALSDLNRRAQVQNPSISRSEVRNSANEKINQLFVLKETAQARAFQMYRFNRELLLLFEGLKQMKKDKNQQGEEDQKQRLRNYIISFTALSNRIKPDKDSLDPEKEKNTYQQIQRATLQELKTISQKLRQEIEGFYPRFVTAYENQQDDVLDHLNHQVVPLYKAKIKTHLRQTQLHLGKPNPNETAILTLIVSLYSYYLKLAQEYAWRWRRAVKNAGVEHIHVVGQHGRLASVYEYGAFRIFQQGSSQNENQERITIIENRWQRERIDGNDTYVLRPTQIIFENLDTAYRSQIHTLLSQEEDYTQILERLASLDYIRDLAKNYHENLSEFYRNEIEFNLALIQEGNGGLRNGIVPQKRNASVSLDAVAIKIQHQKWDEAFQLLDGTIQQLQERLKDIEKKKKGVEARSDFLAHRIRLEETYKAIIELERLLNESNFASAAQLIDLIYQSYYLPIASAAGNYQSIKTRLNILKIGLHRISNSSLSEEETKSILNRMAPSLIEIKHMSNSVKRSEVRNESEVTTAAQKFYSVVLHYEQYELYKELDREDSRRLKQEKIIEQLKEKLAQARELFKDKTGSQEKFQQMEVFISDYDWARFSAIIQKVKDITQKQGEDDFLFSAYDSQKKIFFIAKEILEGFPEALAVELIFREQSSEFLSPKEIKQLFPENYKRSIMDNSPTLEMAIQDLLRKSAVPYDLYELLKHLFTYYRTSIERVLLEGSETRNEKALEDINRESEASSSAIVSELEKLKNYSRPYIRENLMSKLKNIHRQKVLRIEDVVAVMGEIGIWTAIMRDVIAEARANMNMDDADWKQLFLSYSKYYLLSMIKRDDRSKNPWLEEEGKVFKDEYDDFMKAITDYHQGVLDEASKLFQDPLTMSRNLTAIQIKNAVNGQNPSEAFAPLKNARVGMSKIEDYLSFFPEERVSPEIQDLVDEASNRLKEMKDEYLQAFQEVERKLARSGRNPNDSGTSLGPDARRSEMRSEEFIDKRPTDFGLLKDDYVKYFMAIRKLINPDYDEKVVLYAGSGADVSTLLLSTDGTEVYFVDEATVDYENLNKALEQWDDLEKSQEMVDYLKSKFERGYASTKSKVMTNTETKIILELKAMGINRESIHVQNNEDGTVILEFEWNYQGQSARQRNVTFINSMVVNPSSYAPKLKRVLEKGIDIYYQKAGIYIPGKYENFMPDIAPNVKAGGFLVTDDYFVIDEQSQPVIDLQFTLDTIPGVAYQKIDSPEMEKYRSAILNYRLNTEGFIPQSGYGFDLTLRKRLDNSSSRSEMRSTTGSNGKRGVRQVGKRDYALNKRIENFHAQLLNKLHDAVVNKPSSKKEKKLNAELNEYEKKIKPLRNKMDRFLDYLFSYDRATPFQARIRKAMTRAMDLPERNIIFANAEDEIFWNLIGVNPYKLDGASFVLSQGTRLENVVVIDNNKDFRDLKTFVIAAHEVAHAQETYEKTRRYKEPLFRFVNEGYQPYQIRSVIFRIAKADPEFIREIAPRVNNYFLNLERQDTVFLKTIDKKYSQTFIGRLKILPFLPSLNPYVNETKFVQKVIAHLHRLGFPVEQRMALMKSHNAVEWRRALGYPIFDLFKELLRGDEQWQSFRSRGGRELMALLAASVLRPEVKNFNRDKKTRFFQFMKLFHLALRKDTKSGGVDTLKWLRIKYKRQLGYFSRDVEPLILAYINGELDDAALPKKFRELFYKHDVLSIGLEKFLNRSEVRRLAVLLAKEPGKRQFDAELPEWIVQSYGENPEAFANELLAQVRALEYEARQAVMKTLDHQSTTANKSYALAGVFPENVQSAEWMQPYFEGFLQGLETARISEFLKDGGQLSKSFISGLFEQNINLRQINAQKNTVLRQDQKAVPTAVVGRNQQQAFNSIFQPFFIDNLEDIKEDSDALQFLGKLTARALVELADLSEDQALAQDPVKLKEELLRRLNLEDYQNLISNSFRINAKIAQQIFEVLQSRIIQTYA